MSVARRLIGSFGATVFGPAVTVLLQLINVPIMLRVWGPQLFGEWLVLSAIPTYLLLSDLGFGNVAGSDMTMRVHAGDPDGAVETLQSTFVLVGLSTLAIAVLAVSLILLLPLQRMMHLTALQPSEARLTLLLLCLNCLVLLQWSVLMAGYRCTGRYAIGMVYVNCIRIVEGAGIFLILATDARPAALAAYMLIISLIGTAWLAFQQRRAAPWLRLGIRHASKARIRELSRPAFAFMAFPACAALNTQGITLVVGILLGPLAVAVFNPMRTLSRIALQLTDAIKNSAWPELSAAFGRDDLPFARRLHRGAFQASLLLAITVLLALAFTGPWLFRLWTHNRVLMDIPAFHILLLAVLANSIWNASSSVAMSVNRHEDMAANYLALSVAAIVASIPLAHWLGLRGVSLSMLLADAGMSLIVLRISTRLLNDPLSSFLLACARPREIGELLSRLRRNPAK